MFSSDNKSIFDKELRQKYILFNSEKSNRITARFGEFTSEKSFKGNPKCYVNLYTDRRAFLIPSESNGATVNCLCEFFYEKQHMSFLDERFCCVVELQISHENMPNPTASCQMALSPHLTFCFTPLVIPRNIELPPIVVLTATINRIQSGRCSPSKTPESTYATSLPLPLSFSNRPPLQWYISDYSNRRLLLGLPLHSSRLSENLLIPLRIVSPTPTVGSHLLSLQCIFDVRINVVSIIPNSSLVTVLNNYTFVNSSHSFHNIELQMTPGMDRELFSLNATVNAESGETTMPTLQCCIKRSAGIRNENYECGASKIMTLPIEISSMIIIPAIKMAGNVFNIYRTPTVSLSRASVKVYGIVNYRDRTVSDMSSKIEISVIDPERVVIAGGRARTNNVDLNYQNAINRWSVQLSLYDSRYTVLSPMNIWKADSWRLVLSNTILKPIKNWVVPNSASNRENCVPRFKVARLKILCRLYILDELGRKMYVGAEHTKDNIPSFVDVTSLTSISQFRVVPANTISVETSKDSNNFIVSANLIVKSSTIELLSPETSEVISFASISVESDSNSLYITDLMVHCIDALILHQQNRSVNSIHEPNEYESIEVTMMSKTPSLPCYLLVFLEFNDKSVERVSFFDEHHYQMFLESSGNSRSNSISDGQLVIVKWSKDANISLFESTACKDPKLIFSKKTNWGEVVQVQASIGFVTDSPHAIDKQATTNRTNLVLFNNVNEPSGTFFYNWLVVAFIFLGVTLLCLIPIMIFCCKGRSGVRRPTPTCYNISGSGFISDQSKIQIRSQNKKLSTFEKISSNFKRHNNSKSHSGEPYPPLLPPPGPISTNYDLTINDLLCSESAVDSGIELGKLSSYSSNTNPSNDICCSIEQHMPTFIGDDICRQPPQFSNPSFPYYSSNKSGIEPTHPYYENAGSMALPGLRPSLW